MFKDLRSNLQHIVYLEEFNDLHDLGIALDDLGGHDDGAGALVAGGHGHQALLKGNVGLKIAGSSRHVSYL